MGNDKVRINEGTDLRGRFFCRGQGEGAGGIPQALINEGLDFKMGVKAGDIFRHLSHRGDNWTVGGDNAKKRV